MRGINLSILPNEKFAVIICPSNLGTDKSPTAIFFYNGLDSRLKVLFVEYEKGNICITNVIFSSQ